MQTICKEEFMYCKKKALFYTIIIFLLFVYLYIHTVHIHRVMLTHEQEGDDGVEGDGRANHRKYSGEGLHQPRCRCRPAQPGLSGSTRSAISPMSPACSSFQSPSYVRMHVITYFNMLMVVVDTKKGLVNQLHYGTMQNKTKINNIISL